MKQNRTLGNSRVVKHLSGKRDTRNGSLELMCHVVDEVVLYLAQLLLPESQYNSVDKHCHEQECESKRRQHELDRREDILTLGWECDIQRAVVAIRIVGEEKLRVDRALSFDARIIAFGRIGEAA